MEGTCAPYAAGTDPEDECLSGACGESLGCAGDVLWGVSFGNVDDNNFLVASDGSGGLIIAGTFSSPLSLGGAPLNPAGETDFFVAKLSSDGTHAWSKRFGGAGTESIRGVAVDGSGNLAIVGSFSSSFSLGTTTLSTAGGSDIFVAKLDAQGNSIWAAAFGDSEHQLPLAVDAAANGSVVILCYFYGEVEFGGFVPLTSAGSDDICLAKFNADGTHEWSRRFGDGSSNILTSFGIDLGADVKFDSTGSVLIAGGFAGALDFGGGTLPSADVTADIYLAKFTAGGEHVWSKRYGHSAPEAVGALATSTTNNVSIVGTFSGSLVIDSTQLTSAGAADAFVGLWDASGNTLWVDRFGDSEAQGADGVSFAGDDVVATGTFDSAMDLGNRPLIAEGGSDIFVTRFDAGGEPMWRRKFGDPNSSSADGVLSLADGTVASWGTFDGTIDWGDGPVATMGGRDFFVVKLTR